LILSLFIANSVTAILPREEDVRLEMN